MKRLAILIGLMLLLAGAGGAGWWFFLREEPPEALAEEAGDEVGAGGVTLARRFVDLDPFVIPILREGRVIQHMTVVLTLEFSNPLAVERIRELTPRLRDAVLSELHGVFSFRHVQERGENLPVVRDRLVRAGERVFGAGVVKAVLVKAASRRTPDAG